MAQTIRQGHKTPRKEGFIFTLGLVHGLIAGTDPGSPLALAFYLATLLAVGWATRRKLYRYSPPLRRAPNREISKLQQGRRMLPREGASACFANGFANTTRRERERSSGVLEQRGEDLKPS